MIFKLTKKEAIDAIQDYFSRKNGVVPDSGKVAIRMFDIYMTVIADYTSRTMYNISKEDAIKMLFKYYSQDWCMVKPDSVEIID